MNACLTGGGPRVVREATAPRQVAAPRQTQRVDALVVSLCPTGVRQQPALIASLPCS